MSAKNDEKNQLLGRFDEKKLKTGLQ